MAAYLEEAEKIFFNTVIKLPMVVFIAAGHTSSNDGDVSSNHGGNGDAWVVKISATEIAMAKMLWRQWR
jgi:hypothetical protein